MVRIHRAFNQLGHRKLVINKQLGHQREEVVVILSDGDSFECDARQDGFEVRWELALLFERFTRDGVFEFVQRHLEFGVERVDVDGFAFLLP